MASTNQSPEYQSAEKRFLLSKSDEERVLILEEMIRYCPKHKAGESMRANLKTRYVKLKEKIETAKKKKKSSGKDGIKKEGLQVVLIGLANSGKSSLLSCLTNAKSPISQYPYSTLRPILGTMDFTGVKIQIVDLPAIESEYFDSGTANTADTLLLVIDNPKQLEDIFPLLQRSIGEKLIVLNKIDLLTETEKRRSIAFLSSKKYDFVAFSCKTLENIEELKKKIWESFCKIRIYTKQPGKSADSLPVVMEKNSTVKDLAEKIFHGLSRNVKETRVTGPSGKFPSQKVSLDHVLKDRDIVEFRLK